MKYMEHILEKLNPCIKEFKQQKKELEKILLDNRDHIVIYGFGNLGKTFLHNLQKFCGISKKNILFLDTYKPTDIEKQVINISDAQKYIPMDALIIVTMYQVVSEFESIKENLKQKGFCYVRSIAEFKAYPELLQYGLISCDVSKIQKKAVLETYELLADKKSRQAYCNLFDYILTDIFGGGGRIYQFPTCQNSNSI